MLAPQLPEPGRRRRDVSACDHPAIVRFNDVHAALAVNIESHVPFHRAALLFVLGAHSDPVVYRGPYRDGGQPFFIATTLGMM